MNRNTQPIAKACTNGFSNLFLALILAGFFLGACSNSSSDPIDAGSTEPDTTEPDTTEPDTTEPDTTEPDTTEPDAIDPGLCVVPPGTCLTHNDCANSDEHCGAPGTDLGCGMCFGGPDACSSDADCKTEGDHFICQPHPCACGDPSGDGSECVPGCQADTECNPWQACESGRCNAKSCVADTDCPSNFSCVEATEPGANNKCARWTCSDNANCQGCCVFGHCYAQPGNCLLPVP